MIIQKNTRIYQMPIQMQHKVESDIIDSLKEFMDGNSYFNLVNEALEGRLCDIEDLININEYLEV